MSKDQPSIDSFFKPIGRQTPQNKILCIDKDQSPSPTGHIIEISCSQQPTTSSQNVNGCLVRRTSETLRKRKSMAIVSNKTSEEESHTYSSILTNIREQYSEVEDLDRDKNIRSNLAVGSVIADSELSRSASTAVAREEEIQSDSSTVVASCSNSLEDDKTPSVTDEAESHVTAAGAKKATTRKQNDKRKLTPNWNIDLEGKQYIGKGHTGQPRCILCNIDLSGSSFHIRRHLRNPTHLKKVSATLSTAPMVQFSINSIETNDRLLRSQKIRQAELILSGFLARHNLAINIMKELPETLKRAFPDSDIAKGVQCGRTKTTHVINKIIGEVAYVDLCNLMRKNCFSVIIDESTDVSNSKSLVVVIRHVDEVKEAKNGGWKKVVKDSFLQLVEVQQCTAKDIYTVLTKLLFKEIGVPKQNLIGFASDNASVMMGVQGGVQAKLLLDLPNLFVLGCTCHSIHLCASAASHKLPTDVEEFCQDLYNYIGRSPKRAGEFVEMQKFMELDEHRILRHVTTRWLSRLPVIMRYLEQWDCLILFFRSESFKEGNKPAKATAILEKLLSPTFKAYFAFLAYILRQKHL
jgi:hypothetical protein